MKAIIAACGNDCSVCPCFMPKSAAELKAIAEVTRVYSYPYSAIDQSFRYGVNSKAIT